jgi:ribosome assembly protein 4
MTTNENVGKTVIAQFYTTNGEPQGNQMALPIDITNEQLHYLLNEFVLKNNEPLPYSFYINEEEITDTLLKTLQKLGKLTEHEDVISIVYQPQAVFRVRSVTHCTSTLPGHSDAITCVAFSPDGQKLASGSGDTTVRLWDTNTETPYMELRGHSNWVLCLRWSPDGQKLASGSMDQTVIVWDPERGTQLCQLRGHKGPITSLDWEPLHHNENCSRFVSGSKDATAKVWDVSMKQCLFTLAGHTNTITNVRWGGENLIYTASEDRTVKVWAINERGKLIRTLVGHAHWVNTLSLNTDYVLRTGAYDHTGKSYSDPKQAQQLALERWQQVKGKAPERLATGSDDNTLYLWEPAEKKQPLLRLTGHGKPVTLVQFSPDGRLIASASFDKNIKIWSCNGKYLGTLRGHVGEVYQIAWSSDSRLLVSGSKDSTLKVWNIKTLKLDFDLPGHADEVYSVDWSPDGQRVASGGKDKVLKIWRS